METQFDIIIIGAGPGGYVAAIRVAQLGKKVALIEKGEIGGTCLNRGCIPTKTLMHSSHLFYEAGRMREYGVELEGIRCNYPRILERKDEVVHQMRQGVKGILTAHNITLIRGNAKISQLVEGWYQVEVKGEETISYSTSKILIATGSRPVIPKIEGYHLDNIFTSEELLTENHQLYNKLLILGGGVIGVEFATIYRELGCEVEIIEAEDRILPTMDKEISQTIAMGLKKKGVIIHTKSKATRFTQGESGEILCEYISKGEGNSTSGDGVLLAVGRVANTMGLLEKGIKIEMDGPYIQVDDFFETSRKGIYAIGDVIRGLQLAHVASGQGMFVADTIFGNGSLKRLDIIPSCIYTSPEVATVGMEEGKAKELGYHIKVGKYPMLGNGKNLLSGGERGFIKVISDEETGKILGAQLCCDRATDMVGEFTTAIVAGMTVSSMASVIRPHPTYEEAITEALEDVMGMAVHLMPKKH